ncbi:sigma-54-dependent Fis family transcriptional regulator [Bacillus thuringiensis]|uniref:Sigma-54-dependent Fis family transcriptional regulator n=2 Tax=Bacillus thuringiensis TaxID=1428 RepID=A0ABD5HU44_BACTU|nr:MULTISPECIES: sigma 54-interacting transcriptional regulator [Bacillus]EEM98160.1 Arginine utilization regulatory protein RocR [Bacillus thuringiensis IBL 200]MBK5495463.1 sigma 54-interacting transcriptional regulator [Bacillus sp. TH13]MCC6080233.1 sigma 54-interacting transcriptional regulator [Bacillus thuringiensis]MCR6778463.1 sigma 54-interacting transcriptional regulator [Bacillus thuringiensis]MCR6862521.1 sigma 54-interacting transcriptional regulator [Bacillus thuringiensis]
MRTEDINFKQIIEMNMLYETLLNELDIGIHIINEESKTIIYNRKMTEIESMERSDVLYKSPLEIFAFEENKNSTLIEALKLGKTNKNIKQTYFNNKGQEITTINDTFPIIENGKIKGAIEISKEISNLKQTIRMGPSRKQSTKFTFDHIIGDSEAIQSIITEGKRVIRTSSSILLVGETGTGKELFAQSIHNESQRSTKPFISQNCAAIPDTLMESLLFGTNRGAFTGAIDKAGLFEEANGGTLLLDEINSLSPALQAKLLRAIQEKTIRRIGGTHEKEIDVRIIATINEDPFEAIAHNRLREDLYYRLSVVTLCLPPLRERKEDILALVQHFIEKYNTQFGLNVTDVDVNVREFFYAYDWPGNVRELEHIIEGSMNLIEDETIITAFHMPTRFRERIKTEFNMQHALTNHNTDAPKTLKHTIEKMEKNYINQILKENHGNISQAAKFLGLSRQNLQYRIKKLHLHI